MIRREFYTKTQNILVFTSLPLSKLLSLSIWATSVFGSLELNFETFHSNLKSIHGLYGGLGASLVIKTDKSEALALVGRPVNEHLRADDVAKGEEHLHELGVAELLGQVVDEQVAAFGAADRAA